jgi:hypothetical protein
MLSRTSKVLFTGILSLAIPAVAAAAPVYCPAGPAPGNGNERQYFIDTTPDSTCLSHGQGNLAENNDDFLDAIASGTDTFADLGWEFLDTTGSGVGLGDNGHLTMTDTSGGALRSGTFIIDPAIAGLYSMFAIGLKDGGVPQWAVFVLPANVLTGFWGLSSPSGSLSHGALYGILGTPPCTEDCDPEPCVGCPEPLATPEPATLTMLGLGLLGAAGARRRRSRAAARS